MDYGDIRLGETLDIKFTTRRFTTGAPFTLAGSPVISAYVGNGTTEITAGITLTVDFDARTGLNNVRVVATSGNGFATATNVQLVITTGTVDSVSVVGEVVGTFSIEARSALMPTTAARTLDVSAGGEAGLDWANIGGPTTAQNLSATNIDVDQVVASVSGAVGSVTGLTASNLDATVSSRATPAQVNTEVDTALVDVRLDELLSADSDIDGAAPPIVGSVFHELLTKTAGSFTYDQTTDSLEAVRDNMGTAQTGDNFARLGAPAGASVSADVAAVKVDTAAILVDTGTTLDARIPVALVGGRIDASVGAMAANVLTATAINADAITAAKVAADVSAEIADAVWDEDATGHQTTGTFGQAIGDPVADTNTIYKAVVTDATGATVGVDVVAIKADTAAIGAAGAGLTAVPWNASWDAEVQSEATDALNAYDPPTNAELDARTLLAANYATAAALDTVDNFLDTEIADILVDTSTTLDDMVDDLEGRLSAALATALQAHSLAIGRVVIDVGSTTTAVVFELINGSAASAVNDFYNGRALIFTSGALTLQATSITDYVGATKTATVPALTSAPADDVTAVLV